ncbi:hypothetical protein J3R30DRAFT_3283871, partial [Lentinula aciculospora]
PNLYLNLARLLAITSYTMLFPGNMSLVPLDLSMTNVVSSARRNVSVVTSNGQVVYPPAPLSPMLIPRDHPCWCTERFTFSNSRESNWIYCSTQFWLDSYGDVGGINATIEDGVEEPEFHDVSAVCRPTQRLALIINSVQAKIHQRLSSRLKAEMCDSSMKKLVTSGSPQMKQEKQRGRWLKQFCHQASLPYSTLP